MPQVQFCGNDEMLSARIRAVILFGGGGGGSDLANKAAGKSLRVARIEHPATMGD